LALCGTKARLGLGHPMLADDERDALTPPVVVD